MHLACLYVCTLQRIYSRRAGRRAGLLEQSGGEPAQHALHAAPLGLHLWVAGAGRLQSGAEAAAAARGVAAVAAQLTARLRPSRLRVALRLRQLRRRGLALRGHGERCKTQRGGQGG